MSGTAKYLASNSDLGTLNRFLICLIINELEDYCSAEFYRRVDTVLSSGMFSLSNHKQVSILIYF